jgi:DNA-binding transcriptional MerR regulator
MKSCRRALVLALVLLASPAWAQQTPPRSPRDYVALPFEGDLEQMLKDQLQRAQDLDRIAEILRDWQARGIPLDKIDLKTDLSELQRRLEKEPANKRPDAKQIEQLKRALEKIKPAEAMPVPDAPNGGGPGRPDAPEALLPPRKSRPAAEDRKFSRWLEQAMKNAENSGVGDLLRDSPTWKQALQDLHQSIQLGKVGNWIDLDKLAGRLTLPDKLDVKLKLKGWKGVRNLSLPSLGLKLPQLGGWRGPSFGVPSVSAPAAGLALVIVLMAIVLAVVGWRLWSRRWKAQTADDAGWRLGPWPLDPAQVSTREELIRAFEYLSLLRLGRQARAWHHRAIAAGLIEEERSPAAGSRQAAQTLAALYEQARYAPEAAPLSTDNIAVARRGLCLLAGMAAA